MEKSVHDYATISTNNISYSTSKAENVEVYMATLLKHHTTGKLTGWKSLRPNHRKLITSCKMAAVTKLVRA